MSVSGPGAVLTPFGVPAPARAPQPPRTNRLAIIGAAGTIAAVLAGLFFFRPDGGDSTDAPEAAASVGALQIQSTPPGAQVLVDGDPIGLVTPARLSGLRIGRKVDIRVDKPGYKSMKQIVEVPTGGSRLLSFALEESIGVVRIEGLPAHANTYVDDMPVNATQPLSLSVGQHRLRVEVSGHLFASMRVDVRSGTHVVRINPSEGSSP